MVAAGRLGDSNENVTGGDDAGRREDECRRAKEVVGENRIKRSWDEAKTPYERVLATGVLSEEQQARLTSLYARTNPRQLKGEIHQIIETLWDEPKAILGLVKRLGPVAY